MAETPTRTDPMTDDTRLLADARDGIDAFLRLEPALLRVAWNHPTSTLQQGLRPGLIALRNLRARLARQGDPGLADLRLALDSPQAWIEVKLGDIRIGWIKEISYSFADQPTQTARIGFTVHRANKWMLKKPTYDSWRRPWRAFWTSGGPATTPRPEAPMPRSPGPREGSPRSASTRPRPSPP